MKHLILGLGLILTIGCGPAYQLAPQPSQTTSQATPESTPTPVPCIVIDKCTYNHNFDPSPEYNCVVTNYNKSDNTQLNPALFGDSQCITTKEDYHTEESMCGPEHNFPCQIQVQGPGPVATPEDAQ